MKKFIVAINLKNDKNLGFVVPDSSGNEFIGIKNGRKYRYGRVVYVGVDINVEMIFDKINEDLVSVENKNFLRENLDSFLEDISRFKVGDIVKIKKFVLYNSKLRFDKVKKLP